jgi:uncharacterized OB-fold protein
MEEGFKPASPVRSVENERFFDAAREGKLMLKQCNSCKEVFHYPRALCPFCLSESSWIESSGSGVIYSYTEVHMRGGGYVLGMVTLAEGPTMMTNILTPDPSKLAIGQKVRVQFIETAGEERLAVFAPA